MARTRHDAVNAQYHTAAPIVLTESVLTARLKTAATAATAIATAAAAATTVEATKAQVAALANVIKALADGVA